MPGTNGEPGAVDPTDADAVIEAVDADEGVVPQEVRVEDPAFAAALTQVATAIDGVGLTQTLVNPGSDGAYDLGDTEGVDTDTAVAKLNAGLDI